MEDQGCHSDDLTSPGPGLLRQGTPYYFYPSPTSELIHGMCGAPDLMKDVVLVPGH